MRRRSSPKVERTSVPVTWVRTTDPLHPYSATVGPETWTIRINSFPEEHLYSLLTQGQLAESFDDWPSAWKVAASSLQENKSIKINELVAQLHDERQHVNQIILRLERVLQQSTANDAPGGIPSMPRTGPGRRTKHDKRAG